jgi:hypothetical protein
MSPARRYMVHGTCSHTLGQLVHWDAWGLDMGPDSPHQMTSPKKWDRRFWPPQAHAFQCECQVAVTPVNPESSGHSESARFFGSGRSWGVPSLIETYFLGPRIRVW